MQCAYREKLIYGGDWIFGAAYPVFRKTSAGKRRGKFRETSEVQKRNNEWHSTEKLKAYIHENFRKGDYVISPTFDNFTLPENEDEFKRIIRNYIARLKNLYKKAKTELRYIYVKEYGVSGRPHLHIFLPQLPRESGFTRDDVEAVWGKTRINSKRLQFDHCGVIDLAEYLGKERKSGERRFVCSSNVKKPRESANSSAKPYSRKELCAIEEMGNPQAFFAKRYPGYWLSEFPKIYYNAVNGSYYMTFVLYKPDSDNLEWYVKNKRGYFE